MSLDCADVDDTRPIACSVCHVPSLDTVELICRDCRCEACDEAPRAKPSTQCEECLRDLRRGWAEYETRFAEYVREENAKLEAAHVARQAAAGGVVLPRPVGDVGDHDPRDGSIPHSLEGMDRRRADDWRDSLMEPAGSES